MDYIEAQNACVLVCVSERLEKQSETGVCVCLRHFGMNYS